MTETSIQLPEGIAPLDLVLVQIAAVVIACRSLIVAHPNPAEVRRVYDQLQGQMLATAAYLDDPKNGAVLRSMTEILFRPAAPLES